MAMQTVYLKEHEGLVHSSVGQLSSVTSAPWWSALGSQPVYGEYCGQMKSFSLEISNYVDQFGAGKQAARGVEQLSDKGHTTQFTIFPDDCKMSGDAQNPQATLSLQSSLAEPHNRFEIGVNQPMICAKYPYMDQFYGLFSAYGPQISGRIMLPINLTSDEGPTYVNAKQYHGIIRRRQSRAKAVLENKMIKRRKPYMHESRHLHATRRPRGCGGRFLNTKSSTDGNGKNESEVIKTSGRQFQSSASQSSEVLQSEVGMLNSSKQTNRSSPNISGSEVTSMYSREGFDGFSVNPLGSSVHSLADMIGSEHGIIRPTKWVAAVPGNCYNLKI
ncbi:nuclear transcription factor Y subunit A-10-like isoform X2 [Glycine soja]|uniref:Nuclear transcription factor Y subunit n=1 Tax=Glycine soja TaxID=3848 RepID=A0A445LR80_GLYSO|nr:nuclear transcription factor Y subunit A-10-like isoform X2 [Glycine soja]RZC25764.1 Nuclear transcription factor Y subunit A-10 isoform D [Glycine soja]RZC25765.1 Nuclear transcription factor Y subunit A-10 isoform E [Glycine soja]RZC25766.1 Nuclear transcription factor Y subunit A-10 isoform F [Glycine soja]